MSTAALEANAGGVVQAGVTEETFGGNTVLIHGVPLVDDASEPETRLAVCPIRGCGHVVRFGKDGPIHPCSHYRDCLPYPGIGMEAQFADEYYSDVNQFPRQNWDKPPSTFLQLSVLVIAALAGSLITWLGNGIMGGFALRETVSVLATKVDALSDTVKSQQRQIDNAASKEYLSNLAESIVSRLDRIETRVENHDLQTKKLLR